MHKKVEKLPFEKGVSDLKGHGESYLNLCDKEVGRMNRVHTELNKMK